MSLPLGLPSTPGPASLGAWERVIADYRSVGMVLGEHQMALMRAALGRRVSRSIALQKLADGKTVEVAGMVVPRQRPETAKGIVFMLLEDECGTVNLVVPPPVYDRFRSLVRTAPMLRAQGPLRPGRTEA